MIFTGLSNAYANVNSQDFYLHTIRGGVWGAAVP